METTGESTSGAAGGDRPIPAAEVAVPLPTATAREARRYIPTVPLPVFRRICRLGSAGYVYLLIRMRSRVERRASVAVTTAALAEFGFSRKVKDAALCALEDAGLIRVERRRGKNPVATLLD